MFYEHSVIFLYLSSGCVTTSCSLWCLRFLNFFVLQVFADELFQEFHKKNTSQWMYKDAMPLDLELLCYRGYVLV